MRIAARARVCADPRDAEGRRLPADQQGVPLAKDVWMLGIGLGLVIDALTEPASA